MKEAGVDMSVVKVVELDLTTMCNAACPLCFRNHADLPSKYEKPFFRSKKQILAQLDDFRSLRRVELIGQLSEPTTHPEMLQIVEALKARSLDLRICTNGSLHSQDFWRQLGTVLSDDDRVWFTLCGSSQEIHSRYRVGTSLELILDHAAALRNVKRVDGARALVFRYNEEDIQGDEFKAILAQFSRSEMITSCIPEDSTSFKKKFREEDFLPPAKILETYKKLDVLSKIRRRDHIDCQSIDESQMQIDPFGNIYPCYRFFEANPRYTSWNYDEILQGKHACCRFCQRAVSKLKNDLKLNDII